MRDIFHLTIACWILLIAIDPDGSVWQRRQNHQRLYAKLLVACLNGQGFTLGQTIVLCYPTEVIEPLQTVTMKSVP